MVKCPNHCRTDRSGTGDGERIGSSAEPIIRAERNSERINREEIAMFKWCTHHCQPLRSAPSHGAERKRELRLSFFCWDFNIRIWNILSSMSGNINPTLKMASGMSSPSLMTGRDSATKPSTQHDSPKCQLVINYVMKTIKCISISVLGKHLWCYNHEWKVKCY